MFTVTYRVVIVYRASGSRYPDFVSVDADKVGETLAGLKAQGFTIVSVSAPR